VPFLYSPSSFLLVVIVPASVVGIILRRFRQEIHPGPDGGTPGIRHIPHRTAAGIQYILASWISMLILVLIALLVTRKFKN